MWLEVNSLLWYPWHREIGVVVSYNTFLLLLYYFCKSKLRILRGYYNDTTLIRYNVNYCHINTYIFELDSYDITELYAPLIFCYNNTYINAKGQTNTAISGNLVRLYKINAYFLLICFQHTRVTQTIILSVTNRLVSVSLRKDRSPFDLEQISRYGP